jgi:hypothetical protein
MSARPTPDGLQERKADGRVRMSARARAVIVRAVAGSALMPGVSLAAGRRFALQ